MVVYRFGRHRQTTDLPSFYRAQLWGDHFSKAVALGSASNFLTSIDKRAM
jgi:hypothetical protein